MSDAALLWFDFGGGIKVEGSDLVSDKGLVTAVLLSLFIDKRAEIEQLPFGQSDLRGYWADDEADRHGSLLWLLQREKVTNETIARAREYTEQALEWLISDGIASSVEVQASRSGIYAIQIKVAITRGQSSQYQYLWDGMKTARIKTENTTIEIEFA